MMNVPSGSVRIPPPAPGGDVFRLIETTSNSAGGVADWACRAGRLHSATAIDVVSKMTWRIQVPRFAEVYACSGRSRNTLVTSWRRHKTVSPALHPRLGRAHNVVPQFRKRVRTVRFWV